MLSEWSRVDNSLNIPISIDSRFTSTKTQGLINAEMDVEIGSIFGVSEKPRNIALRNAPQGAARSRLDEATGARTSIRDGDSIGFAKEGVVPGLH
jgi:hypothetical protein